MRERFPISAEPTIAELARHVDQLHVCVDNTADRVDEALEKYEALANEQRSDRHASRNRDTALLGGLRILLQDKGYELELDSEGALKAIKAPDPKSVWERLAPAATVIGTALGALGSYKAAAAVLSLIHHALAAR